MTGSGSLKATIFVSRIFCCLGNCLTKSRIWRNVSDMLRSAFISLFLLKYTKSKYVGGDATIVMRKCALVVTHKPGRTHKGPAVLYPEVAGNPDVDGANVFRRSRIIDES